MKYIVEYENGLKRIIFSKERIQDIRLNEVKDTFGVEIRIPQEGLRSICQI